MEQNGSIKYIHNTRTKRFKIETNKTTALQKAFISLIGKSSTNILLVKDTNNSFEIHDFFLLEVHYCLNLLMDEHKILAVDIGGIVLTDLIDTLETKTWLHGRHSGNIEKLFNFKHLKKNMKFLPLQHQERVFTKYEEVKSISNLRGFVIDVAAGGGKALKHGTLVKRLGGHIPIEDIKKDMYITGSDGFPVRVLGVFPQGLRELVTFTFSNGTEVTSDLDHLWGVFNSDEVYSVMKTKDLIKLLPTNKYSVPTLHGHNAEIVSFNDAGKDLATCIAVENDSKLFALEGDILTHNTYISLAMSELLDYDLTVLLVPKSTVYSPWVKSVTTDLFNTPQSYVVFDSSKSKYNDERFIITHYEFLPKLMEDKKLARRIKRIKPNLVFDEFHNFNDIKSKRAESLLKFVEYMKFTDISLLTGTPIKFKISELKTMLYVLDAKFPKIMHLFDKFYNNSALQGIKLDLLHSRFNLYRERVENSSTTMGEIAIVENKVTVPDGKDYTLKTIDKRMREYKDKRIVTVMREMPEYQREFNLILSNLVKEHLSLGEKVNEYKKYVAKIRKHSDEGTMYTIYLMVNEATIIEKEYIIPNLSSVNKVKFRELKSLVKYPKLKILGEALGKILLGARIDCYKDLAMNTNYEDLVKLTHKKTLIFSNYVSVAATAMDKCEKLNYNPLPVYGAHLKDLAKNVDKFNDLKSDNKVLCATYKSLSTGTPLPSANVVILIDMALRNFQLEQAISRAYRIGNNEEVLVFINKLDTGNDINLTDRDLFIVNTSERNVELITGTSPVFDMPQQPKESHIDEEYEMVVTEELTKELTSSFSEQVSNPLDMIKSIMKKIKII